MLKYSETIYRLVTCWIYDHYVVVEPNILVDSLTDFHELPSSPLLPFPLQAFIKEEPMICFRENLCSERHGCHWLV